MLNIYLLIQARHNKAISRDTWSQLLEFARVINKYKLTPPSSIVPFFLCYGLCSLYLFINFKKMTYHIATVKENDLNLRLNPNTVVFLLMCPELVLGVLFQLEIHTTQIRVKSFVVVMLYVPHGANVELPLITNCFTYFLYKCRQWILHYQTMIQMGLGHIWLMNLLTIWLKMA